MGSVSDPAGLIVALLDANWSTVTGGSKPTIDKTWFDESHPLTISTDARTKELKHVSIKEIAASHEMFGELIERVSLMIQIDVWARTDANARLMRDEIKRILRANANDPATGIDFITVLSWQDMSAFDTIDELYRYMGTAELQYEED